MKKGSMRGTSPLLMLHKEYETIMHAPMKAVDRDKALSRLMDQIKAEFGVPLLDDPEWDQKHRPVIALYRKVSESRTTLWS